MKVDFGYVKFCFRHNCMYKNYPLIPPALDKRLDSFYVRLADSFFYCKVSNITRNGLSVRQEKDLTYRIILTCLQIYVYYTRT